MKGHPSATKRHRVEVNVLMSGSESNVVVGDQASSAKTSGLLVTTSSTSPAPSSANFIPNHNLSNTMDKLRAITLSWRTTAAIVKGEIPRRTTALEFSRVQDGAAPFLRNHSTSALAVFLFLHPPQQCAIRPHFTFTSIIRTYDSLKPALTRVRATDRSPAVKSLQEITKTTQQVSLAQQKMLGHCSR